MHGQLYASSLQGVPRVPRVVAPQFVPSTSQQFVRPRGLALAHRTGRQPPPPVLARNNIVAAASVLHEAAPGQRVIADSFTDDLLSFPQEKLQARVTEELEAHGVLLITPVITPCQYPPGSKRVFAAYNNPDDARRAVATITGAGFALHLGYVPAKTLEDGRKKIILHLDELDMPRRPEESDVKASVTSREVWISQFPNDRELWGWIRGFGEVQEVYKMKVPATTLDASRGYVLFKTHGGAEACVKAGGGQWSESERALDGFRKTRGEVVMRTYPECIVSLLRGENGEDLESMRDAAGVDTLVLMGTETSAAGVSARDMGSRRVHFIAEGNVECVDKVQPILEIKLAAIHEEVRVGLTDEWEAERQIEYEDSQRRALPQEMSTRRDSAGEKRKRVETPSGSHDHERQAFSKHGRSSLPPPAPRPRPSTSFQS